MKATKQIIQDTYDNNPKLKEQLDFYKLSLEDVGLQVIQTKSHFVTGDNKPIVLGYSMEEERVISCSTSFVHPLIEESMRENRLQAISGQAQRG